MTSVIQDARLFVLFCSKLKVTSVTQDAESIMLFSKLIVTSVTQDTRLFLLFSKLIVASVTQDAESIMSFFEIDDDKCHLTCRIICVVVPN